MQSKLDQAEKALAKEKESGGKNVEALQNQLEQLAREKDGLVECAKESA